MTATKKPTTPRGKVCQSELDAAQARWAEEAAAVADARQRLFRFMLEGDDVASPLDQARGLALAMAAVVSDLAPDDSGAMFTVARCLLDKIDQHIADFERAREDAQVCGVVPTPAVPVGAPA